nr:VOC family protein [Agilicoccus flavus]
MARPRRQAVPPRPQRAGPRRRHRPGIELGATLAQPQPAEAAGKWVVLLDPAGHPFCFAIWG